MTPALLILALLGLLWLLGVGVEAAWDQRRYGRMAEPLKMERDCNLFFRQRRP